MGLSARTGLILFSMLGSLGVAACGGSPAVADGPLPDAATLAPDAACSLPPGIGFVISDLEVAAGDVGVDLDGDGAVDNMIGSIPDGVRQSTSDELQVWLEEGVILLLYFVGWTDYPDPNVPALSFYVLVGEDADEPVNPANNLGGEGVFTVPDRQFDLDCQLLDESDHASIVDGVLSAETGTWDFPILVGEGGRATFLDSQLRCTFDATFTHLSCTMSGTWPVCSLSSVPFPGEIAGSLLDAFINDDALRSSLSIDMDRDGDGLEQVIGDGLSVLKCIDGNGDVIQSRDCPCHPSIADGYSYTLRFNAVPASIVGADGP